MGKTDEELRRTIDTAWAHANSGNWMGWTEMFAEDCSFMNSNTVEPLRGRGTLVKLAGSFPFITNERQWTAVDGNRLVTAWLERKGKDRGDAPWYYGISSFLFDDHGKVVEYIGIFDREAARRSDAHGGWNARGDQARSA